ncbi:MAG TPA: hypothetical protein VGI44_17900 [Acidimicrobiales bacterium]
MEPRSLRRVLNLPRAQRLKVVAQGLDLLTEHVAKLHDDLLHLVEGDRLRSAVVVDALASEEAAKVMILLDLVRIGWADQEAARRQIARFYNHMARGLYVRLVDGKPGSLSEVRGYANALRQSLYLDGPNDVDWIFRNEILADREDSLYVDYVSTEGKCFWVTPASRDDYPALRPSLIIEVVIALRRVGCTGFDGLEIIAKAWHGIEITNDTHWQTVASINREIINRLHREGLFTPDVTTRDISLVREHWTFPLTAVDLEEIKVSPASLQAKRDQWLADQQ